MSEKMWAITGHCGLYVGTHFTRQDMIREHTSQVGSTWEECRRSGDRAIKVLVFTEDELAELEPTAKDG